MGMPGGMPCRIPSQESQGALQTLTVENSSLRLQPEILTSTWNGIVSRPSSIQPHLSLGMHSGTGSARVPTTIVQQSESAQGTESPVFSKLPCAQVQHNKGLHVLGAASTYHVK